ncbi:MAG: hypothetical protein U0401_14060 [Anaerolineae bacterium]
MTGPLTLSLAYPDALALVGREAGQALGLIDSAHLDCGHRRHTALGCHQRGLYARPAEIRTDELGQQAVDLAYLGRSTLPPCRASILEYQSRLRTAQNVGEVAAQKLIAIADLPNRLVGRAASSKSG